MIQRFCDTRVFITTVLWSLLKNYSRIHQTSVSHETLERYFISSQTTIGNSKEITNRPITYSAYRTEYIHAVFLCGIPQA